MVEDGVPYCTCVPALTRSSSLRASTYPCLTGMPDALTLEA